KYGDHKKSKSFFENAKARLEMLENCAEVFDKLLIDKSKKIKQIFELSLKISETRKDFAIELSSKIEEELRQLSMEKACFKIEFSPLPTLDTCEKYLSANGFDEIEFLFSANVGQSLKPFSKIASGGEISRFMLALKTVTGDEKNIPTLIFDEVDAGISGKTGQEVAKKLARISRNHQVLCITHLPQIAAMADTHFYIDKAVVLDKISKKEAAQTVVSRLDDFQMIAEVARLSGGANISSSAISNASDIKNWSKDFKKTL
ncbi:MAG: DNA repair protein RecN, partial [Firmicutes bacterium]|nr:DNA repair protein RecN [Bacillota bacterium]